MAASAQSFRRIRTAPTLLAGAILLLQAPLSALATSACPAVIKAGSKEFILKCKLPLRYEPSIEIELQDLADLQTPPSTFFYDVTWGRLCADRECRQCRAHNGKSVGCWRAPKYVAVEQLDDGYAKDVVFAIVLGTLLLDYLLGLTSRLLNYHALGTPMPSEFRDVYDAEAYTKSAEYTRAKTAFALASDTCQLLTLLLFWLGWNGFEWLDELAISFFNGDEASDSSLQLWRGLFYWGVLASFEMMLGLPWAVYRNFVLEERFGFNRTSPATFLQDRLKEIVLLILLGAPIGGGVIVFFLYAGEWAWFYCWLFLSVVQLVLHLAMPVLILPLFYTFTPIPDGVLKSRVQEYAQKVNFNFVGIFEVDGSRRSSHSNAFFVGIGATKRIALFDTLIEQATTEELVAILAHEVGHEKLRHVQINMIIGLVYTFTLFSIMSLFLGYEPLFAAFGVSRPSIYVGLLLFQLLFSPVDSLLQIFLTMLSRHNEFAADAYSVDTAKDPEALCAALKKLSKRSLDNLTPHPLYVFLNFSHPPMLQRIQAIRKHAKLAARSD